MRNRTDKSRPVQAVNLTGGPTPGDFPLWALAGWDAGATDQCSIGDGVGNAQGINDGLAQLPAPTLATPWLDYLGLTDVGGGAGQANLQGLFRNGSGQVLATAVVFDVWVSADSLGPVVPAAVTGVLGAVRPGYDAGGAGANGCCFSFTTDATGGFELTLTGTVGDTLSVMLRYQGLRTIDAVGPLT